MRQLAIIIRTSVMALSAVLVFGSLTAPLRSLDSFLPFVVPPAARLGGAVLLGAGALLLFSCFVLFAAGGALSAGPTFPDPPVFISRGPYRLVRNPMAKGLFTVLTGWGLYLRSPAFLLFTGCLAVAMHLLVVLVEEPKLRRRFGASYDSYCARVGRWLPRWRASPL
ncbi:MAG: isoprenylcysteine carboxylmethyltransferase family protein [Acidobacteriota bacterium]